MSSTFIILLISLDFINLTRNNHFSQIEVLVFDRGGCSQQQGLSGCLRGVPLSSLACHHLYLVTMTSVHTDHIPEPILS